MSDATTRAAVNSCPYCGDENLFPHEPAQDVAGEQGAGHGAWHCRSCTRVFTVRFVGLRAVPNRQAAR